MSLEKTIDLLKDADRNRYGIAAFNVFNYETIHWAIKAAEEERVPILIQFYPGYTKHISIPTVAALTKELAGKVKVPVGLHLDHSFSYEQALEGVSAGFLSVMIDGSSLPFEENIKITKSVVEAAHKEGVEVEAELGHVGSGSVADDFKNDNNFTSPKDAVQFIDETKADSLAISIGNAHGAYVATPSLDFKRLEAINRILSAPLVLHGGSDIPDDQLKMAITLGINKINIATEYNRAFFKGLKELMEKNTGFDLYSCLLDTERYATEFIMRKIRTLNPLDYHR